MNLNPRRFPWLLALCTLVLLVWGIGSWWGWPQTWVERLLYRPLAGEPYRSSQAPWWGRLDGWIHLVTVGGLSLVAVAWCQRYAWRRRWAFLTVAAIALADESLQAFAPRRTSSIIDMTYSALGLVIVLLVSSWWLRLRTRWSTAYQPATNDHSQ